MSIDPAPERAGPPTRRLGEDGMLLVELMLAMTVLAVAILTLYGTLISTQAASRTSRDRHQALQDVTALMEQIAAMPLTNVPGVFAHDTEIPEFNDLHLPDQRVRLRYAAGDPTLRPLAYEVVCTYRTVLGRPATVLVNGVRAR